MTSSYVVRSAAATSPRGTTRASYGVPSTVPRKPPVSLRSSDPGTRSHGFTPP